MSISVKKIEESNEVVIYVCENFVFANHKDFREAYRYESPSCQYRVNLASAQYLDSSALGMLLLLRKHAGGDTAKVVIEDIPEEVRKVLEIANFHKLFTLK